MTHYVVLPDEHGPVDDKQIVNLLASHAVFLCGKCSNDATKVYHNLLGQHRHNVAAYLWS